jgi:hypothetical protein
MLLAQQADTPQQGPTITPEQVVLRDEGGLRGDPLVEGVECCPRGADGLGGGRHPAGHLGGLGIESGGLGTHAVDLLRGDRRALLRGVGLLREEHQPLVREARQPAEPLLHALEPVHDRAGTVHVVADHALLDLLLPGAGLVEAFGQDDPLGLPAGFDLLVLVQLAAQAHDVVREDAGLGVPGDGGDGLGLAGDLGLTTQGLQLAADLPRQVGQPCQVRLHRGELAEGLLLAAAVLEDPGGLLDEAAPVLRGGAQDLVELALPDDHVHLAPEAGVAEELLDVEESAVLAVDGVLAAAVAEQRAGDRDLGVVDRQQAVGVVDREQHLCPAERTPARGAGEDDVLHRAAAEGLRPLLPHHPGEGVDDVGLARAVRTDDARDAGLEREGRRLREGLEPLDGQALQVHAVSGLPRCRKANAWWPADAVGTRGNGGWTGS